MGLFGFGKGKNAAPQGQNNTKARVVVLGSGCAKCNTLESVAAQALATLGIDEQVGHITDFAIIATYGVMQTPALVLDGKVLCCGRVPTADEVQSLLLQNGIRDSRI